MIPQLVSHAVRTLRGCLCNVLQRPLGTPSSPQGNSLLRAKADRAARASKKSSLSRETAASNEAPLHVEPSDLASAAPAPPVDVPAPSRDNKPLPLPLSRVSMLAAEADVESGQSSPQGNALLDRKRRASSGRAPSSFATE